jgi:hypothetical protein
MLILRTGKNIHVDADLAQMAGQFSDIHIHSTGVFTAEGSQWASVVRKHCNIQWDILAFK